VSLSVGGNCDANPNLDPQGIAAGIFTYAMVNVPSYLLDLYVFKTETWPSAYWTNLNSSPVKEETKEEEMTAAPTGHL
jgi:hypothetical protein